MGDNLAELLYMAWRSSLLSSQPDLPSWGNVRDPDLRAAWEAAATKARAEMARRFVRSVNSVETGLREHADGEAWTADQRRGFDQAFLALGTVRDEWSAR